MYCLETISQILGRLQMVLTNCVSKWLIFLRLQWSSILSVKTSSAISGEIQFFTFNISTASVWIFLWGIGFFLKRILTSELYTVFLQNYLLSPNFKSVLFVEVDISSNESHTRTCFQESYVTTLIMPSTGTIYQRVPLM